MTTPASPPAAWYPDPHDAAQLRWWDGGRWTDHVEPRPATAAVAPGFPAAGPAAPTAATAVVPQVAQAHAWSPQASAWSAPAGAPGVSGSPAAAAAGAFSTPAASYAPASTVGAGSAGGGFTPASAADPYAPTSTLGGYQPVGAYGRVPAGPTSWGGTPTGGAPWGAAVDATNKYATWALVAGVVVLVIMLFTHYVLASGLAIWVGAKGVARARAIRREGHPTAVGMARSVVGLCLSVGGALLYLLTLGLELSLGM
ncbi:DUF2510 domain-containing protein [Cellulomonas fimi]|uniref:DUF2510 domain-containing protein n=1 Tax=Cellulomonas fimi TaxID=1708 RepID=UPI00234CE34E|nr:DUF2510 domain-containing protein [Cellulomonas fimi]MDC7122035.1 DUF2510 domain-containing protein [Cellulomonas fimi]